MTSARRAFPDHPLVVGMLLVIVFAQAFLSSRIKSTTFDEPAHIGAGLSYLKTGDFKVNLQHPPLLKEIAALPLLAIDTTWPLDEAQWAMVRTPPERNLQWYLGQEVIFRNDPDRVLMASRLPFMLVATLLGWVIYSWGRRLLGGGAAVGALFLYALDPTIVAHAQLVATDVGFAFFGLLLIVALWSWLNHRSLKRWVLCGLALGAVLATKFTAVLFVPVILILLVWAIRWIPAAVPSRDPTLVDPYLPDDRGLRLVWGLYCFLGLLMIAAFVVQALYFFPSDPFLYLRGLMLVNADHRQGFQAYMAGGFGDRFWTYYLVAWLLKEPIATIICVVLGLVVLMRDSRFTEMDRVILLLAPGVLFLAYSLFSHNLGIRYIIPVMPFLFLAGGAGLAWLWGGTGALRKTIALVLCAWLLVAAAGIYPDHLSYFNEAACLFDEPARIGLDGGSECGPSWFDDSNVDWGQGLIQLRAWIQENAPGRYMRLGYFGSTRPGYYGLDHDRIGVDDLLRQPIPGLYALSGHIVARTKGELNRIHGDGPGNWLLHQRPVAIVGHAYYIYDIGDR